jgi:hypothetical protein
VLTNFVSLKVYLQIAGAVWQDANRQDRYAAEHAGGYLPLSITGGGGHINVQNVSRAANAATRQTHCTRFSAADR